MKLITRFCALLALLAGSYGFAQTLINPASISSYPYVISTPGSYKLTGNINVGTSSIGAIYINTNNVTLDLNGYSITGTMVCTASSCTGGGSGTYGVEAIDSNTVVMNGNISGFYNCMYMNGAGRIENLNISSCVTGINAGQQGIVRHNNVSNCNGWGIAIYNGQVTENNVATSHQGIYGYQSAVITNTVIGSTGYGLYVYNSAYEDNILMSNSNDFYAVGEVASIKTSICTTLGPC
jgi:hypothetical protein